LVQVLEEEDSHSLDGSRVALAGEDAKDLVGLAAVDLEHEAVQVHTGSGILAVDDSDPVEVSKSNGGWRMQVDPRIEDIQAVVVHKAREEDAHNVLELSGQEDMILEDIVPDAQDLVVALEEEDLAAAEAAHRQFVHLLGVQEVHEEILGCSIAQSHVPPRVGIADAERAALQSQPC
jgi:hypothetical protein